MKKRTLNLVLALTDNQKINFKNMINDYIHLFMKPEGSFIGEKRTYTPREGTMDEPTKRGIKRIIVTVDEKINNLIESSKEYINNLFTQERTNAIGIAQSDLIVEGVNWGTFTSLELLRLKSLIESQDSGKLELLLNEIPVRSDGEVWKPSTNLDYTERNVFETHMIEGVAKTTNKVEFILDDPNIHKLKDTSSYVPVKSMRTDVYELGDYTLQRFSGEWSQLQQINALKRRTSLLTAVIDALKRANDCEVTESSLTAEKIFNYIFYGK